MPISRCNRAGFRLLLGLALVVITGLSLIPHPAPVDTDLPVDKLMHLLAFLLLGFLVDASWPDNGFDIPKWVGLLVYGLAIELVQLTVPGRLFDLWDLVADAAGLALYGLAALPLLRRLGLR